MNPPSAGALRLVAAVALCALGMRYPPPQELGRVVLEQRAQRAGVPGVEFDHWRHRARFTCRLCHVDVGFAMAASQTGVSAETNRGGFHCGACHDGKRLYRETAIFTACTAATRVDGPGTCRRCHARADPAKARADYEQFAARMPRNAYGAVDWEKAEAQGRIQLVDFLEAVSVPRPALRMDKDVAIAAKASWVDDIIFSHRKHAIWNGCEVCHPDIFPATRAGELKYSMFEISRGEFCGACHDKVAFPLADCGGCHKKQVQ